METDKITLEDFMINFTAISEIIIKEYLSFYDKCRTNSFGIELNDVMAYLDIDNRDSLKTKIIKNFQLDLDYIEKMKEIENTTNTYGTLIYVTFETFQKICMMSKTEKASKVRDYHVKLFKLLKYIDSYKNEISNAIMENYYGKYN